jgi:S-adenosylmethionine-diacylglycerol 3-amino-3-carboxypropyl transferase
MDPNPVALDHIRTKIDALRQGVPLSKFNVADDDPTGLSQCGNFESLFRTFRRFIQEFILTRDQLHVLFSKAGSFEQGRLAMLSSPYWPVAFELVFSEGFLRTMFGQDAIQYAPKGSYPRYFQERFEFGLNRPAAQSNPFLHHIFLGKYLPHAIPEFLKFRPENLDFSWLNRSAEDVNFREYDCIGLSNILDWMPPETVEHMLSRIHTETRSGCTVIWRQLNNTRPFHRHLQPHFSFDPEWEKALNTADRSLFYTRLHVGHRRQ